MSGERLTPEYEQEIRRIIGEHGEHWPCLIQWGGDVAILLAEIDALRADLATSEARAERLSEFKERALDMADVVAHHLIGGDPEERFVARDAARSLIALADQHDREARAVPAAEPDAGGNRDV